MIPMAAILPPSCLRARLKPCHKASERQRALASEVRTPRDTPISSSIYRFLVIALTATCCNIAVAQSQSPGYFVRGPIPEGQVPLVSLIQLIANPQTYDGKRVRVIGYLHLEFETEAIYLHREDFEQRINQNAVWLELPANLTKSQKEAVNDKYVICTGVFKAIEGVTLGGFPGEIKDVNRLEPTGNTK
jgi:hypothetical protein